MGHQDDSGHYAPHRLAPLCLEIHDLRDLDDEVVGWLREAADRAE
jgi:hypothetical protein